MRHADTEWTHRQVDGRSDGGQRDRQADRWDGVGPLTPLSPGLFESVGPERSDTEPGAATVQPRTAAGDRRGEHGLRFVLIPGHLPGRGRQDPEGTTHTHTHAHTVRRLCEDEIKRKIKRNKHNKVTDTLVFNIR